jgi:hypothetical protein
MRTGFEILSPTLHRVYSFNFDKHATPVVFIILINLKQHVYLIFYFIIQSYRKL